VPKDLEGGLGGEGVGFLCNSVSIGGANGGKGKQIFPQKKGMGHVGRYAP